MKYLFVLILCWGIFCKSSPAQTVGSGPGNARSVPVDQQNQDKARALLNQAIQALGGPAYLGIRDVTQEGRTYSFHLGNPTSAGLLFWRFYRYPDKDRFELTKQRDVVEVFNGGNGAEITFKGMHPMDAKDVADYARRARCALDVVLREWISQPGVALFYDGPSVADQKPAEQVTVMNSHDQAVTLYLDSNTHLPVKKSFTWRDPADQQRNIEDEVYDGYRISGGVMTPFVVTRYYNGDMSNQRFINSTTYNTGLKDSLFNVGSTPGKPSALP